MFIDYFFGDHQPDAGAFGTFGRKKLFKNITNTEDGKQLIRANGSVGANYIEANEALSRKDFVLRIKLCRKEAKESRYWLRLIDVQNNQELDKQRKDLEK